MVTIFLSFHPSALSLVLQQGLRFMDATAVALCMEHKMPLIVLDMKVQGEVERAIRGEKVGTLIEA